MMTEEIPQRRGRYDVLFQTERDDICEITVSVSADSPEEALDVARDCVDVDGELSVDPYWSKAHGVSLDEQQAKAFNR